MHTTQDVCDGKWRARIMRYSTALMIGLAIPIGLPWNGGYTRLAFSLASLGGASIYWFFSARQPMNAKHLVVVTGCDSGLGFSLALHCHKLGAIVIAGVLETDGKTAKRLVKNGIIVHYLDITNEEIVKQFGKHVGELLKERNLVLRALVNNAAVMIFGEFEWQTEDQARHQIEVNLLGTMRITRELMPIIRADSSRIIVISSHCALESLPGLSIYGATKAGLQAWLTSLRVEVAKYGIKVVSFIPGNFVKESNIMARQSQHFQTMHSAMTPEAMEFYGDYFTQYRDYFCFIEPKNDIRCLVNQSIYKTFNGALLDVYPSAVYKYEPWRYLFYFVLFKNTPVWIRDRLVQRFVRQPLWMR